MNIHDDCQTTSSPEHRCMSPIPGLRGTARSDAPPSQARGPALSATARAVIAVQRSAGNRAVGRVRGTMIGPGFGTGFRPTPGAGDRSIVVARRSQTGLVAAAPTERFAGAALRFWRNPSNKTRPLSDYGDFLVEQANARLAAIGVPPCAHNHEETRREASFSVVRWTIELNPRDFVSSTRGATVGSLTRQDAAERVDSVYHEARHAEQTFRVARMLAGQGASIGVIAQETKMPWLQAALAFIAPLRGDTAANRRLLGEATEWDPFETGRYELYQARMRELNTAADSYFRGAEAWLTVSQTNVLARSFEDSTRSRSRWRGTRSEQSSSATSNPRSERSRTCRRSARPIGSFAAT
jgi:hypothetical protein